MLEQQNPYSKIFLLVASRSSIPGTSRSSLIEPGSRTAFRIGLVPLDLRMFCDKALIFRVLAGEALKAGSAAA